MLKRPLLIAALVALVVLLSFLDILAFKYFWYWRLWWFDMVMHLLGGLLLGLMALWFYALSHQIELKAISVRRTIFIALFTAIAFGGLWEFFEFGVDHFYIDGLGFKSIRALQLGFGDSVGDMVFDIVGGLFGALLVIVISRWKQKKLP